jgi:hypothetical protein
LNLGLRGCGIDDMTYTGPLNFREYVEKANRECKAAKIPWYWYIALICLGIDIIVTLIGAVCGIVWIWYNILIGGFVK